MLLEPHLSGTVLILGIGASMMFVGGISLETGAALGIGLGVLGVAVLAIRHPALWTEPHHAVDGPLGHSAADEGVSDRCRACCAIGSGGLLGLGLRQGPAEATCTSPRSTTTMIFAIVCEELGFVGAALILLLFVLARSAGLLDRHARPGSLRRRCWWWASPPMIGMQTFLNIGGGDELRPRTPASPCPFSATAARR